MGRNPPSGSGPTFGSGAPGPRRAGSGLHRLERVETGRLRMEAEAQNLCSLAPWTPARGPPGVRGLGFLTCPPAGTHHSGRGRGAGSLHAGCRVLLRAPEQFSPYIWVDPRPSAPRWLTISPLKTPRTPWDNPPVGFPLRAPRDLCCVQRGDFGVGIMRGFPGG